jgi:hypothetical protein
MTRKVGSRGIFLVRRPGVDLLLSEECQLANTLLLATASVQVNLRRLGLNGRIARKVGCSAPSSLHRTPVGWAIDRLDGGG